MAGSCSEEGARAARRAWRDTWGSGSSRRSPCWPMRSGGCRRSRSARRGWPAVSGFYPFDESVWGRLLQIVGLLGAGPGADPGDLDRRACWSDWRRWAGGGGGGDRAGRFLGAGFAWGYLAGALRASIALEPGRNTYAFYAGAAVAAGFGWSAVRDRLRGSAAPARSLGGRRPAPARDPAVRPRCSRASRRRRAHDPVLVAEDSAGDGLTSFWSRPDPPTLSSDPQSGSSLDRSITSSTVRAGGPDPLRGGGPVGRRPCRHLRRAAARGPAADAGRGRGDRRTFPARAGSGELHAIRHGPALRRRRLGAGRFRALRPALRAGGDGLLVTRGRGRSAGAIRILCEIVVDREPIMIAKIRRLRRGRDPGIGRGRG